MVDDRKVQGYRETVRPLLGPPVSAWGPRDHDEAEREHGPSGDALLAACRSNPHLAGFFAREVAGDESAWEPWLAATAPDHREPVIIAANALSSTYLDQDRDIDAALFWAETHLQLSRTLPAWFGPRQSRLGYGRDQYISVALIALAELETMRGSVDRAHDLLLEAEQHFDAEQEVRRRAGIVERPVAERILEIGGGPEGLYRRLSRSAWQVGDEAEARRYHLLAVDHRNDDQTAQSEISELIRHGEYHLAFDRPDFALKHFQRAVSLGEAEQMESLVAQVASNAYHSMARAYGKLGTPRTALAMLDKAEALIKGTGSGKRDLLAAIEVSAAHILRGSPTLGDALQHLLRALEYCSLPAAPGRRRGTAVPTVTASGTGFRKAYWDFMAKDDSYLHTNRELRLMVSAPAGEPVVAALAVRARLRLPGLKNLIPVRKKGGLASTVVLVPAPAEG